MPKRIQRKRTKGWRMPAGAVYVGRPTIFGNPWRRFDQPALNVHKYREWLLGRIRPAHLDRQAVLTALKDLRGKDLVCWCKPGEPCHADVLLEIANA